MWQVQGKGVYVYPAPDALGRRADDDVCVLYGVWKQALLVNLFRIFSSLKLTGKKPSKKRWKFC